MGNITIQGDLTGGVPGGEVGGASDLTTVGAIPYVSAAGILNQDPTALFWDTTNHRLGVGTCSPSVALDLASGSFKAGGGVFTGDMSPLTNNSISMGNSSTRWSSVYALNFDAGGNTVMMTGWDISLQVSGTPKALLAHSGNFLVGTTTDGNYKLDVAASGSAGTLRVYDQTATTGVTNVVVRAGAGQSTTPLTTWQDSAGTTVAQLQQTFGLQLQNGSNVRLQLRQDTGAIYTLSSALFAWSASSTNVTSVPADLSLSRSAANTLQVGDGGANANGVISLTRSQHSGVLVSALPAAAAGNAGSIQYVTDANATTIGSTVAGGGANKVLVWSNGTAWKIFAS